MRPMEQLKSLHRTGLQKTAPKRAAPGAAEELYLKIFDHSNDAIFVIDPGADTIVDVNPKACVMLGYDRNELLMIPISAVHPNEMLKLQAFAESVFRPGSGWVDQRA